MEGKGADLPPPCVSSLLLPLIAQMPALVRWNRDAKSTYSWPHTHPIRGDKRRVGCVVDIGLGRDQRSRVTVVVVAVDHILEPHFYRFNTGLPERLRTQKRLRGRHAAANAAAVRSFSDEK